MANINPSRPTKLWWLVGVVLLCTALVVQLPASWLVQKFAPNSPYLQQITGNLSQGQANWQVMMNPTKPLTGTVNWQWQPWQLFTGKLGMAVRIKSGKTTLDGQIKIGKNNWQASGFHGKISPDTLKQVVSWQLPDAPIIVKEVTLSKTPQGFDDARGVLNWAGGELGYPTGGRVYKINMPSMIGSLSIDKSHDKSADKTAASNNETNATTGTGKRLHLAMTTPQGQRLGDLYIDNDNMLDVALTQRLLKHMPDYKGQGADDSVVVSLRQPLTSLGQ